MPWKEATKVSERVEMARLFSSGLYSVTELAEMFHVSRPTIYLWARRYVEEGEEGLVDRPPIAKSCPHRTDAAIAERIVAAKQIKPHWGPKKLLDWLRLEDAERTWPAASTAGEILNQRGLVRKRPQRRRAQDKAELPYLDSLESGQMMTGDHKGEFRLGNGRYCYPLTICDPVSRFVYAIDAVDSTSIECGARGAEFGARGSEFGVLLRRIRKSTLLSA
jgi:putative transposase